MRNQLTENDFSGKSFSQNESINRWYNPLQQNIADAKYHEVLVDGQEKGANGAIFIPKGQFDFYQAKEACANQGAHMYAPETKKQTDATIAWFTDFIKVS